MKKIKIIIITILMLTFLSQTVFANTVTFDTLEQTIKLLDIMVGDESGNMNLQNEVTRAEFAKMVIKASQFKDIVNEDSKLSVFKDVKYDHWAASYINTVVNEKWFTGYVDGTFKPNNKIKFEEAATVALRLLGYTDEDFTGAYPSAQISKFNYLGLNRNINLQKGRDLTREECMYLFYNLMHAKTKSGEIYAKTLGYTLNASGELDHSSLLLSKMSRPSIVYNSTWTDILPFSIENATVYKNGKKSNISSITTYDVVYYNKSLRSIWAYSNKIIGAYTAATPNTAAPKEVTVAGNKYEIGTSEAAYKLSDMGDIKIGDTIALILGMEGTVVDVVSGSNFNSVRCGVVIKSEKSVSADGKIANRITVACTDGTVQEYDVKSGSYDVGRAVSINYVNNEIKINSANIGSNISSYKLADNVEIMDVNSYGDYKFIYKDRLAGTVLNQNNVLCYTLNSNKQIDKLILNDATGDLYNYGIVTSIEEIDEKTPEGSWIMNGSYKYILSGKTELYNTINKLLNISVGPSIIKYKNNMVDSISNLSKINVTSINELYAIDGAQKYMLSDNVQVYLNKNGTYYLTELSNVLDLNKFTLNGYHDIDFKLGKRIRVIIATEK